MYNQNMFWIVEYIQENNLEKKMRVGNWRSEKIFKRNGQTKRKWN